MSAERRNPLLRTLDRYVGIPLVWALGARRLVRRSIPPAPRRIGVMKTAGIGDTVLVSAITADLAERGAEVVLFTGAENAAAGRLIAGVAEVVPLALKRPWVAAGQVRSARLDLLIDCGPWPRINAVLCALSGVHTVGFRAPGQGRHFAHDTVVQHRRDVHEVENYRALTAAIGIPPRHQPALTPRVDTPKIAIERPYVVLHAWSGGFKGWQKEWPLDRWATLGRALAERGYVLALSGSPGDRERTRALADAIGPVATAVEDLSGRLALAELTDVLRFADLVVSVNTGVVHLSAALGVPTVSLEGPTRPERWGPVGPRTIAVSSALPGCGFLHFGWDYDGHRADCMEGVTVEAVLHAASATGERAPDDGWRPGGCGDAPGLRKG